MPLSDHIEELLNQRSEYQMRTRDIEGELEQLLVDYKGSLLDALKDGLVRPNFPTSPGFKRFLREG